MRDVLDKPPGRAGAAEQRDYAEELADAIIADCSGDPRAAVLAMVRINYSLMAELSMLSGKGADVHASLRRQ